MASFLSGFSPTSGKIGGIGPDRLSKETDTLEGGTKPGKAPTQKLPKAPDSFELIKLQAKANRTNEIGPSGSTTNYEDPTTGVWTQKREFSPELKGLYDKQINLLNTPVSRDFSGDSNKLEASTFERQKGLLDPMYNNRENDMRSMLANKGIMEGSDAWNRDFADFGRDRKEAYNTAALDSIGAGRSEQGRLFGQELAGRQSTFNELAALLGGQQVGSPAQLDVTGPFNSAYQGQLTGVNARNANATKRNSDTTSAAATGTGAVLTALPYLSSLFSSAFVKENKQPIDDHVILDKVSSMDVEKWTYKPGITGETNPHIGPYAEQFAELFGVGDGIHINMIDAIGVCLSSIKALNAKIAILEAKHVQ